MLRRRFKQARKAAALFRQPAWRSALRKGVAAAIEHRPLADLGAIRTIVDIGANRGQFALFCLEAFPEAQIFCFEPLPGPVAQFRSVLGSTPRVHLFTSAIGETRGEMTINLSNRDDSSSFLPITNEQVRYAPGTHAVGQLAVHMAPLEDFLDPAQIREPALLKIDVQGFEKPVLAGCAPLLERFAFLAIELSFRELYAGQALAGEIIGELAGKGFALAGFYSHDPASRHLPVQADFVFSRSS